MNAVNQKCIVSDRSGPWSTGTGFSASASGSDNTGAGGPAVKAPKAMTMDGGSRNKGQAGRRNAREVHHNGGPTAIATGSTNPPR